MSGCVTQLVAKGQQDVHLTGDPQVSFFRSSYKRHSNFSYTVEQQSIDGTYVSNGMSKIKFERKGDLLGYVYLIIHNGTSTIDVPHDKWSDYIARAELVIGGQVIDDQDIVFMEQLAPDLMAQNLSKSALGNLHSGIGGTSSRFFPFRFFFCENWQSMLPLVCLQYHDVEIRITWGPNVQHLVQCYACFACIDKAERDWFVDNTHDMLIQQVQKSKAPRSQVHEFAFSHPVKYIASSNAPVGSTNPLASTTNRIKIQIDGIDLTPFKYASPCFTTATSYYHCPFAFGNETDFFLYTFCLDTSKLQPTGTLNFSRLDTVRIISETSDLTYDVYAVNYNVLRIQQGMGGLMYAS